MNRKRQILSSGLALKCTLSSALLVICGWIYAICDLNALIYEMGAGVAAKVPVKVQGNDCWKSVNHQNKNPWQGNTQEIQSPCVALPP